MNSNIVSRWFCWPADSTIHIIAHDIFAGDAIGNFLFDLFDLFSLNNINCRLYATNFNDSRITKEEEVFQKINETDLIFFNFSIYDPFFEKISKLDSKKILYFHGITPPELLVEFDEITASLCEKGLGQFEYISNFNAIMANSSFTGNQIINSTSCNKKSFKVIPPFINKDRWSDIENTGTKYNESNFTLLYVGRFVPHKKIEDIIVLFSELHKNISDSRLILAGSFGDNEYKKYIDSVINERCEGFTDKIIMPGFITNSELKNIYSSSDIYISMSEHEGFCMPLIEAMNFGIPVFCFSAGATEETMGHSGIIFYKKDMKSIIRDILYVKENQDFKNSFIQKQYQNLKLIEKKSNGDLIWEIIADLLNSNPTDKY